jgi:uncharacterized protein YgiM (DUF1202 family)
VFGFSVDFWAWVSIVCLLFALIAYVVVKKSSKAFFKNVAQIKVYVFAFLFLFFVGISFVKYNNEITSNTAIVMEESVIIKSEPNRSSDNVFELYAGSKVVIISQQNNWSQVRFGANEGWIKDSNVESI